MRRAWQATRGSSRQRRLGNFFVAESLAQRGLQAQPALDGLLREQDPRKHFRQRADFEAAFRSRLAGKKDPAIRAIDPAERHVLVNTRPDAGLDRVLAHPGRRQLVRGGG